MIFHFLQSSYRFMLHVSRSKPLINKPCGILSNDHAQDRQAYMCPVTRSSLTVLHHARHTVQKQKQKLRIKPHFFDKIKSMIYFLYSLLISCRLEQPSSRLSNGLPVSLSLIIRALHIFSCGALFLEVRRLLGKAAFPGGRFQSCERSSQLSAGHSNLQS